MATPPHGAQDTHETLQHADDTARRIDIPASAASCTARKARPSSSCPHPHRAPLTRSHHPPAPLAAAPQPHEQPGRARKYEYSELARLRNGWSDDHTIPNLKRMRPGALAGPGERTSRTCTPADAPATPSARRRPRNPPARLIAAIKAIPATARVDRQALTGETGGTEERGAREGGDGVYPQAHATDCAQFKRTQHTSPARNRAGATVQARTCCPGAQHKKEARKAPARAKDAQGDGTHLHARTIRQPAAVPATARAYGQAHTRETS
ncbi:hypothetical protein C8J57DRAFT_1732395 [Mycena rebaudengoi]|nr:hypothetical protein C8J57DRAFT_1732395 [Mycena rebaudengoi]